MNYLPLRMQPCYKEYIWGGQRLKKEYGKTNAPDVTAESWELSANAAGFSTVAEGELAGYSIQELGKLDRIGFWGTNCESPEFPVLVKLIDAARNLSIQVHPSDDTARREMGEQGKAEMWYIVDCDPFAGIYFGFSKSISKEAFLQHATEGSICEVLNFVPVKRGDVFYILPGTVHAIGEGIVIAEIQQNSDTTFRIYDYKRKGPDGKERPLHLARASEVLDYTPIVPSECRANSTVTFAGFSMTEMFSCRYFRAYCVDIHGEVELCCDGRSFHHLLCVEGNGVIYVGERQYPLHRGNSFFMPAALGEYQIKGECRVLLSRV